MRFDHKAAVSDADDLTADDVDVDVGDDVVGDERWKNSMIRNRIGMIFLH